MLQLKNFKKWLPFIIGIVLFRVFYTFNPLQVNPAAVNILAIAVLMITWWVTEALPMPVVAMLPFVLFPLMKVATIKETAAPYADPIIFLFMGGFMLGLAIEKWHLHKRIALSIVNITGTSGNRIILGFILATGFLSMWLSNTATTMMMFPIAASVIHVVKENHKGNGNTNAFAAAIMLSIAYASNFGGIATIIGTPPNVAFVAFIEKKYNYTPQFADWMLICTPLSLLLLTSLYWVLVKWLMPNHIESDTATKTLIKTELQQLGPLSVAEKRVLVVFIGTATLWITKDLINATGIIKLDDTIIALLGGISLFAIPSGATANEKTAPLLEWKDTNKMAWGILLLFGGGLTLAAALEKAGLITQLGNWVASYAGSSLFLLIFLTAFISLFLSELMSNVAQVIVFAPVMGGIADALGINPLLLGLPMTLGASCASMMPMGTPPNAIVFASGYLKLKDMLKAGFVMNLVAVVLITLFSYYLIPLLMNFVK
ncbi:MAG: DASS family sodium-coupled anion symporter [Sphingobacteriales bacterium]|nr:MAG: DASS family sodium-coupled anion symporter [Sphingobacteriales bacterium]